jgi:CHAT domain-containing protein
LPGLLVVADALEKQVAPIVTLRGIEATAPRVLAGMETAEALLYAGHAEYRSDRPLQSALLVAPTRTDPAGKIFTWAALALAHPPKVVLLVGCETARLWKGKASFSDDFIGLPRALLAAGARHVVGALWPVVDRDAEDFLRAVFAVDADVDPVRAVGQAQACLATGRCVSRGIASWASYVVDAR